MKAKKMIVPILMGVLMAFAILPMTAGKAYAEDYELYVGGTPVTSDNALDILGNKTVSYDAESKTLTLNDVPTGTYTITEQGTEQDGAAQIANYTLTGTFTATAKVEKGKTATASITNIYNRKTESFAVEAFMRRLLLLLCMILLLVIPALAEDAAVQDCAAVLGQPLQLRYTVPETGAGSLTLTDAEGHPLRELLSQRTMIGGKHALNLEASFLHGLQAGEYKIVLTLDGIQSSGTLTLTRWAP